MNLWTLQNEVAEWSDRNFGSDPAHRLRPLLGMIEELGELAEETYIDALFPKTDAEECTRDLLTCQALLGRLVHRALKSMQGIRGHDESEIRHLMIAADKLASDLVELCGRHGIPNKIHLTAGQEVSREKQSDAIGDIEIYKADFCRRNGLNLGDVVAETWARVKQRDWKANPETGEELAA